MRKIQKTLPAQIITDQDIMFIAFALSNTTWRLTFSDSNEKRYILLKQGI